MIMQIQPTLHEEFRKLNLELVQQGYLANLTATPTLEDKIQMAQLHDSRIKIIKANKLNASLWMTKKPCSLKVIL
jgi:hypothetical protein